MRNFVYYNCHMKFNTANSFPLTRLIPLFFVLFLLPRMGNAQLSGTYTIDPGKAASATNYKSFSDAVMDLDSGKRVSGTVNGPGVSGAVIFEVANGTYKEQIHITHVKGSSAKNTVTFTSASGDSSKAILVFTISKITLPNYTVLIDSADHINFTHLTFKMADFKKYGGFGRVISIEHSSSNIKFANNRLIGITYTGNAGTGSELVYSDYSNHNYDTFINNYCFHGYVAFSIQGNPNYEKGLLIEGNKIDSANTEGIKILFQDSAVIRKNSVLVFQQGQNKCSGLWAESCINEVIISDNRLYTFMADLSVVIYKNSGVQKIFNNVLIANSGRYTYSGGMYFGFNDSILVYYNSVQIATGIIGISAGYFAANKASDIANNIFSNECEGWSVCLMTPHNTHHNGYYTAGGYLGYVGTGYVKTKAEWLAAQPSDTTSYFGFPAYYGKKELQTKNMNYFQSGVPTKITNLDVNGFVRNALTPDMGAYVIIRPMNDAGIEALDSPGAILCKKTQDIYARVRNNGSNYISGVKIGWKINGVSQTDVYYKDSIAPGKLSKSVFLGSASLNDTGNTIVAYTKQPNATNDRDSSNDTLAMQGLSLGMDGKYTIGGKGADFNSIGAAVKKITARGVCGSVIFNIADSSYKERISIDTVPGASRHRTVVFQSATGDSSKAVITYPGGSGPLLSLKNTSFVSFKKMSFVISGTKDENPMYFFGLIHNIGFESCRIIGTKPGKTRNVNYLIYARSSFDSIDFTNNLFKYGSCAIYTFPEISVYSSGAISFHHNIIDSTNYYNLFLNGAGPYEVKDNLIDNGMGTIFYACHKGKISNNRIFVPKDGLGMFLEFDNSGYTGDSTFIDNNFISTGYADENTAVYGIYLNTCLYANVLHNNILVNNKTPQSIAMLTYNQDYLRMHDVVLNNNFVNMGSGLAVGYDTTTIDRSDYNNIYCKNVFPVCNYSYYPPVLQTLNDFTSFTGLDSHSVSTDPMYLGKKDLHVRSAAIDGRGIPGTAITSDFDYEKRNALRPDIGADEFTPGLHDAAIVAIDSPLNICGGVKHDVYVTLVDSGGDTLKNVMIGWSVNGNLQTAYKWTGSLMPGASAKVKIGNYAFSASKGNSIKVWCYTPNGFKDLNMQNDTTMDSTVYAGLSGTYTIGGVSPDYSTVSAAVNDLNRSGLCGAVVFNIRDGVYNEQLEILNIMNSSAKNTVTFQSQSGDSSKVSIRYASGTSLNYVVRLNGADYITFRHLSLVRTGNKSNAHVVEIYGAACHNAFRNCRIMGIKIPTGSTTITDAETIISNADLDSFTTFDNNVIHGGSYAMYFTGIYSVPQFVTEYGTTIINNDIDSFSKTGISLYTQDSSRISGNTIKVQELGGNGMELYYQKSARIDKNKITLYKIGYGILYMPFINILDSVRIENNFISQSTSKLYNSYGGMWLMGGNMLVANNSISVDGGYCIDFRNSYNKINLSLLNNNFVNIGTAGALLYYAPNSVFISDHNNFYTKGAVLNQMYSSTGGLVPYATFSAWQTTGMDSNSISADPMYVSKTDLHAKSSAIFNKGIPVGGITTDIDNEKRNSTAPDIGADEISFGAQDVGVISLLSPDSISCRDSSKKMIAVVSNLGFANSDTCHVYIRVGTGTVYSQTVKSLVSGQRDTIVFPATLNTYLADSFDITCRTALGKDINHGNDTLHSKVKIEKVNASWIATNVAGYHVRFSPKDSTTSGNTYSWDFGDSAKSNLMQATHTYKGDGDYKVRLMVVGKNGCSASDTGTIRLHYTDIKENGISNGCILGIAPNPMTERSDLDLYLDKDSRVLIKLMDVHGKLISCICNSSLGEGNHTFTLKRQSLGLNSGIYYIEVHIGEKMICKKIAVVSGVTD